MPQAQPLQQTVSAGKRSTTRPRLILALVSSLGVSVMVAATAGATQTGLGAPTYWPWLLTGLQVLALWAAGHKRGWGWLLGASVQLPWIAYALVTEQLGFIPGCVVSAAVQTYSFVAGRDAVDIPAPEPPTRRLELYA